MVTSQPVPEILPGWAVARGTPVDMIDSVKSRIDELYGSVIGIVAGNDVAGRIIRHLILPRGLVAEARREISNVEQAIFEGLSAGFSTSLEACWTESIRTIA